MKTWTDEQNELLRKLWPTGESLKPHLGSFGNRRYTTIISHAHKILGLGPRPKSDRGLPGYAWDMIRAELTRLPGSAPDLIRRTGLTSAPVCKYLSEANPGHNGEIHIIAWRKRLTTGGAPVAVYAIGPGENAPKPAPYTTAEKWKMKRARCGASKNPFAVVTGMVNAPALTPGRVYIHLTDSKDDEYAEAA
ncbi:hypothetical protein PQR71_42160 [Paraburkholderia fungorum]|uniref:hypothetical protein n=1 Tax=Paraburkholderia fungorum TaxID=134537 RepID=UPI0038BE0AEF